MQARKGVAEASRGDGVAGLVGDVGNGDACGPAVGQDVEDAPFCQAEVLVLPPLPQGLTGGQGFVGAQCAQAFGGDQQVSASLEVARCAQ